MYGNFRSLTAKIEEYLVADTPGDLFAKILERLEQDFESGLHNRFASWHEYLMFKNRARISYDMFSIHNVCIGQVMTL